MEKVRRDYFGDEINIGDEVLFCDGKVAFEKGRVLSFTNKKVIVLPEYYYNHANIAEYYKSSKFEKNLILVRITNPEEFRKTLMPV